MNYKNDKSVPELDFFLPAVFKDNDGYSRIGRVYLEGRKQCNIDLKMPTDILEKKRKPKGKERMIAYTLAYHRALLKNGSFSKKSALEAAEWLGIKDENSIIKTANGNEYSLPKNSVLVAYEDPVGIVTLLEPQKITVELGKLFYQGMMWTWKVGDQKASIGVGTLNGIGYSVIASPIRELNSRKNKALRGGK